MLKPLQRRFDTMERTREVMIARIQSLDGLCFHRPAPDEMSILDLLEHLVEAEEEALHQADEWVKTPTQRGQWSPITLAFLCLVLRYDRKLPFSPALEHPVPEKTARLSDVLTRWDAARAGLRARLERRTPETVHQTVYRHPVGGDLDSEQALVLALAHLDYHGKAIRALARRYRGAYLIA